MNSEIDQVYV